MHLVLLSCEAVLYDTIKRSYHYILITRTNHKKHLFIITTIENDQIHILVGKPQI